MKERPLYVFDHEYQLIQTTTISEASVLLGVSKRAIRAGLLDGRCVSAKYYFSRDRVFKLIAKHKDHNFLTQPSNRNMAALAKTDKYYRSSEEDED